MDEITFEGVKNRLNEIADAVQSPDITMDEALALYEEAVKLGMHACEVSEEDLHGEERDDAEAAEVNAPDQMSEDVSVHEGSNEDERAQ